MRNAGRGARSPNRRLDFSNKEGALPSEAKVSISPPSQQPADPPPDPDPEDASPEASARARPARVPFPPQTPGKAPVRDWEARRIVSPMDRPRTLERWREEIRTAVTAWAVSRGRAEPNEKEVDDWAAFSWSASPDYRPKWNHSSSAQRWRSSKAAALRSSARRTRYAAIRRLKREGRSRASIGASLGVSRTTIWRALRTVSAPCRNERIREMREGLKKGWPLQGAETSRARAAAAPLACSASVAPAHQPHYYPCVAPISSTHAQGVSP